MTVDGEGADAGALRQGAALLVLHRMLDGRAAGSERSAALSRRLRRHPLGCAGDQLAEAARRAALGAPGDARGEELRPDVQARSGGGGGDRGVRRDRRREGRRDRGSAALHPTIRRRSSGRRRAAAARSPRRTPTVIRKIWEGPKRRDGSFLWYGLPRGSTVRTERDRRDAA